MPSVTVWTASGTTLTFQTDFTQALGDEIYVKIEMI